MDALLRQALVQVLDRAGQHDGTTQAYPFAHLAGKYEGSAWDELLAEIDKSDSNLVEQDGHLLFRFVEIVDY